MTISLCGLYLSCIGAAMSGIARIGEGLLAVVVFMFTRHQGLQSASHGLSGWWYVAFVFLLTFVFFTRRVFRQLDGGKFAESWARWQKRREAEKRVLAERRV